MGMMRKAAMRMVWAGLGVLPLAALAQESARSRALGTGLGFGMMGMFCCVYLAIYIYFALCIYKIAQKCGVEMAWLAWIPIIQIIPLIQAGKKPVWWILLLLVPLLNIVIGVIIWMAVAEQRGKPSWVGILMIVPVANLIIPAYLAFSD